MKNLVVSILFFLIGLCVGSFLNVCIYRIPEKLSVVHPRSRCGKCGFTLKPYDMIPVLSYFLLRGSCRNCKTKFSIRYPLIEFLTGILFFICTLVESDILTLYFMCFFTSLLIVAFFIDLDHMIIPNRLILLGLIVGGILIVFNFVYGYSVYLSDSKIDGLIGAATGVGIMFFLERLLTYVYKGKTVLGLGDVKLYLVIGLFLGIRLTLLTIWLSFILGGVTSLVLVLFFRLDMKSSVPFAPFITASAYVSLIFGANIMGFIGF